MRVITHRKSFKDIYTPLTLLNKAYKLYTLDDQNFDSRQNQNFNKRIITLIIVKI